MPRYEYIFRYETTMVHWAELEEQLDDLGEIGWRVAQTGIDRDHDTWFLLEHKIPDTDTPAAAAPSEREARLEEALAGANECVRNQMETITRLEALLGRVLAIETEYFLPAGLLSDIEEALRP